MGGHGKGGKQPAQVAGVENEAGPQAADVAAVVAVAPDLPQHRSRARPGVDCRLVVRAGAAGMPSSPEGWRARSIVGSAWGFGLRPVP